MGWIGESELRDFIWGGVGREARNFGELEAGGVGSLRGRSVGYWSAPVGLRSEGGMRWEAGGADR